ncbi:hypothetical protein VB711_06550 [Cronbergia sp. UHCC 0137]|nr:hypothetical protein [Cronbergia sp. UHCC 0137]MEA5617497.1 hypothetical protein [Cronbergia sp. UHCC 0137]
MGNTYFTFILFYFIAISLVSLAMPAVSVAIALPQILLQRS